eukprot:TRINITY_DN1528_c0_g1_i10.p1 TRINITY_DN1528_c0_g1~~TRINITY_DN1528_c0_g1_i10.p1  ORF type:complete len:115 (+),score=12.70 TRINITY_DN1528_c0_g1_i10:833-1177(+)
MPERRRLTDEERGRAMAWLQEGVGVREVGRRLQVSHSVITTLRDRYRETGSIAEFKRQIQIRANHPPPANLAQLYEFLNAEWQAIPQRTLRTLVESMWPRCVDCINARGGHTRF